MWNLYSIPVILILYILYSFHLSKKGNPAQSRLQSFFLSRKSQFQSDFVAIHTHMHPCLQRPCVSHNKQLPEKGVAFAFAVSVSDSVFGLDFLGLRCTCTRNREH